MSLRNALHSIILLPLLLGAAVAAGEEAESGNVLAVVEGRDITVNDFISEAKKYEGRILSAAQKEALLERMVRYEMLYAAALKAGYDKKPEIIEGIRRMVAGQFHADTLGPEISKVSVGDSEVKAYYDGHASEFVSPSTVRAALIKVSVPAMASEERKAELYKRAVKAREEAEKLPPATRSFGSVAVKYSDDMASRYKGGDMGLIKAGEDMGWDKAVTGAVFSLKKAGEISPIINAPSGYYIAKLIEINASSPLPLEDVEEFIRYRILNDKKQMAEEEFFNKLKAEVSVSVNSGLLKTIEVPGEELTPPALPRR